MTTNTQYLRPDRTIETFKARNKEVFIFNNQGLYFDVFESREKLDLFMEGKVSRGNYYFENEKELDSFLNKL